MVAAVSIVKETRTLYVVQRKFGRKAYMSLRSACAARTRDIIEAKHESESPEYDDDFGRCTHPGWYWRTHLPRAEVLYRRLLRIVTKAAKEL